MPADIYPADMYPWVFNVLFPINRWVHLVAGTVLVGGVLFFEFVVPIATEDLKEEQRLAVFGRARWVFRRLFWISVIAMTISGAVSLWRLWAVYLADEAHVGGFLVGPRPWVAGHVLLGVLGFALVLRVVHVRRVMSKP